LANKSLIFSQNKSSKQVLNSDASRAIKSFTSYTTHFDIVRKLVSEPI